MPLKTFMISVLFLCVGAIAFAQDVDVCVEAVQAALDDALEYCADSGENTLCYASGTQELAARGTLSADYDEVGDIVETGLVATLAMSSTVESQAIAVLRPRAGFVDATLTMIALGNVSLENLGSFRSDFVAAPVTVSDRNGAQVYSEPDFPTDEYLFWGYELSAIGRTANSAWIRVFLPDFRSVWVVATDINADFNVALLPVIEPFEVVDPALGSMQAFNLVSGIGDAPCVGAPESGLLIQSPDLEREAYLQVSDLEIYFTGTIFLQSQPDEALVVSVLEGQANLVMVGDVFTLHVGELMRYPLNGDSVGVRGQPEEYHYAAARNLPSLYLLQRAFELPFSTGGLLTPYVEGALASVLADDACTVAWTVDVNLRAGPGTNYPLRQGVAANFSAQPDGRASGTDGFLWWRLADGIWLNAENTIAAGTCGTLPLLDAENTG